MNVKIELLKNHIVDFINSHIEDFEINADEIADTVAITMLSKIQEIIQNEELSDFEVVEQIVCLFEKYHLNFGGRHDF